MSGWSVIVYGGACRSNMDSIHSPRVDGLMPYVPGEQAPGDGWVKLNTNENPYPPSPAAIAAIAAAAAQGLERYPDPQARRLRERIAAHHGVPTEQVFVGNGSDEVLALAFCAFFQHGQQPLLMADVTYGFYEVYCRLYGIRCAPVPVDDHLRLDLDGFAARAASDIAGIVIANPNADRRGLPPGRVQRLLDLRPDRLVLVDEAYVDFGGQSAIELVDRYANLLVVQTLSKSRALAGLRVGFAIGQAPLIEALERIKNSFNSYPLGRLAQAGAAAAIDDRAHFEATRQAIMRSRTKLMMQLKLLGFDVLPSQANFCSSAIPARTRGSWRRACGTRESSCGISGSPGWSSICASPWAPKSRWHTWCAPCAPCCRRRARGMRAAAMP